MLLVLFFQTFCNKSYLIMSIVQANSCSWSNFSFLFTLRFPAVRDFIRNIESVKPDIVPFGVNW